MDAITELKQMPVEERAKLKWNDPRLDAVAERLEKLHGLPNGAVRAVKYAENTGYKDGKISLSNNDSSTTSPKGAKGIMQFTESTMNLQNGAFKHNTQDPIESMDAAARYLKHTTDKQYKGNIVAAIADYNGGPNAAKYVLKGKKPKIPETATYLNKAGIYFKEQGIQPATQKKKKM